MWDKSVSFPVIDRKFGIGSVSVGDIKKNKNFIFKFVTRTERGPGAWKPLNKSANPVLEDALFTWLLQQRHVPVRGDVGFNASREWLDKFKKRHEIRPLKMEGKKLSSVEAAIGPLQQGFQKVIREKI